MPPQVLRDVGIWISGEDFGGVSNAVGLDPTMDTPESTTFASAGWREYEGGLKVASFTLDGFFDADRDESQFASLGTEKSVLVVPSGQDAGDVAYVVPVAVSAHSVSGAIGELKAFTYAAEGDGALARGQVFDIREEVTADNVTARVNLGPILTGETLEMWVHCTRRAGRLQLELQSAVDGTTASATTRDVEAGINTTRLVKLSVAGPITDAWWQLRYDFSVGSPDFDFASAAAIG